jgi:pilus assembly protein CpaC
MLKRILSLILFCLSLVFIRAEADSTDKKIAITVAQSRTFTLDRPAKRMSVANPEVADVVVLGPTEYYVLGKDIGVTNIIVWDRETGARSSIEVEVTHDLEGLKSRLFRLIPNQSIEVTSAQRSIVLAGSVPSATAMTTAIRIAEGYVPRSAMRDIEAGPAGGGARRESSRGGGEVINLLQVAGAQQVMIEVKVAEIARSELKRMNARFNAFGVRGSWSGGGVNGGASFPDASFGTSQLRAPSIDSRGSSILAPVLDEFAPNETVISNQGIFTSYFSESFIFNLVLDAAKEQGLAKILAEPTLTTLTGQEATFLSGGEFPIPIPQGDRSVTISFKDFGIQLKVLPVVLAGDRINARLDISVSELSNATSVLINPSQTNASFVVPSLTRRSATGTVELADGQTIALAGLFSDNLRSLVTKFPGLGSMPILGALFRSQDYREGSTELVILVTPRLARPIDPKRLELPTDRYREPTDWDFYMLGRLFAPESTAPATNAPAAAESANQESAP